MKRLFSLILALMLLATSMTACAAEPRASDYFDGYGTSLSCLGDGKIKITFSCDANGTASQLGVSNFSVYKYNGSGWEVISGPHSGSYGYGVTSYSFSRTFYGIAGEKYRVEATFLSTKSDATSETKTHTSGSIVAN